MHKVLPLIGTNATGPNCYNAVQLWHSPGARSRFVDSDEMIDWLHHSTEEVDATDARPGDIMVFESPGGGLGHAAIYLGPDEFGTAHVFHKVGYDCDEWGYETRDLPYVQQTQYYFLVFVGYRRYVNRAVVAA